MAYATQASVEGILGRPLTAAEITALPALLAAVDAFINKTIGRTFSNGTEATRYYDAERSRMLDVDPFVTGDGKPFSVFYVDADENKVGDDIDSSDYEARPRNETVKTWLQRRSGTWGSGCPSNVTNIAVKAFYGAGAVPDDIAYAAAWLAANAFGSTASLSLKSESIEGYSRTFADGQKTNVQIQAIFDNYFEVLL